jgi:hypothetical protein
MIKCKNFLLLSMLSINIKLVLQVGWILLKILVLLKFGFFAGKPKNRLSSKNRNRGFAQTENRGTRFLTGFVLP